MHIDLASPQGNAFCLMGLVRDVGRQMDMSRSEIDAITTEMRGGNYANLLSVMERHFPGLFEFYNDPRTECECEGDYE